MTRIVGYTDRASVRGGERIACHVGLLSDVMSAEADYRAELVRVVGVDETGDAERVEPIASEVAGEYVACVQDTSLGSYGTADLGEVGADGLSVHVTFMPTLLAGDEQGLIGVGEPAAGVLAELSLTLDATGRPVLVVGHPTAGVRRLELAISVEAHAWYRMSGGVSGAEAFLELAAVGGEATEIVRTTAPAPSGVTFGSPTAFFGCRPALDGGRVRPSCSFTGRLEDPSVASPATVLGAWDFGIDPGSFEVRDTSGRERHARLAGLPVRCVTGSNWDGITAGVHDAPEQYRAAHFFADAIEDAGWPVAFSAAIPADLPSGVYAFVLTTADDADTVPFVVAPSGAPRADVLVLLPTATYLAYSNARFTWEKVNWEIQRERTVELGRGEQILLERPELGASSYDQHLDGTTITHVSWRRPNLDMRAGQRRGENYRSDLRLIAWLERERRTYDVVTDGDLDRAGRELLDPYRVVVTGTHPEYASTSCCRALETFVADGGRLAVLGGNAFHFLVAFSPERPWIMEVRKADGAAPGSRAAAEGHLALTGELGDAPDGPRPSERFLGTSTASMGFDAPRPYERVPASDEPAAAFVFAGVPDRVIAAGTANADVVFQEWDSTEGVSGFAFGPAGPTVLARSTAHSVTTRWFGATKRRNHAELTFFATSTGGAVFSAASMGWCLALHAPPVARITANVLDRFADPAPFEVDPT